ncbi:hypothetical protein XacyCFBP1159_13245 [Xanthomonas arboricola pv. corylina]|nr:hypothetical protein XacyCFBP1159_13245 [Xanthomonas arboricola pv. corylina]
MLPEQLHLAYAPGLQTVEISMGTNAKISWARALVISGWMSAGAALAFGVLGFIGQIRFGKDAAAWVQAVGSIAAILIAVAVPAAQHRLATNARSQEAADRARSLGLQLLPHMMSLAEKNGDIWAYEHPDHHVEIAGPDQCFLGERTEQALTVPKGIADVVGQLHELGSAAEGLQHALYNIERARELLTVVMVVPNSDSFYGDEPFERTLIFEKTAFYDLMDEALKGLTRSQNKIEALFRHPSSPLAPPKQ